MDIRRLLSQAMELPKARFTGNERLAEMERWDSLALLNFMALIDANYGITLSSEKLLQCESIADIEAVVAEARSPSPSPSDESVHQLN
jgi:acyl carrier protein